jgi:DNA-binding NarL/FixJ family response regulator
MNDVRTGAILLISANWQTRALLAGELGERAERDVLSTPDVNGALALIKLTGLDPAVIVVDAGRRGSPGEVERLLEAKKRVPLVLIISGLRREAFDALRGRCAVYLVRPVSIGAIARAVVRLLER